MNISVFNKNPNRSRFIRRAALALAAVCAFSLAACASKDDPGSFIPGEIVSVNTPVPSQESLTAAPTALPIRTENVRSSDSTDGLLVLVNYDHGYAHTDDVGGRTAFVSDGKSKSLLLTNNDHRLLPATIKALNGFADAFFEETGGDRLLITSAYRTMQYQQNVFDQYVAERGLDMAKLYVADPGKSEHHTGYAVDLSTMSADGLRIPLAEHKSLEWVNANCVKHGFILRYPVGSESVTHVAYEPWHFRYVGTEHAAVITELKMLYEEYVEHLCVYTVDTEVLHASYRADGGVELAPVKFDALPDGGFIIYHVKADSGEMTAVPLPYEFREYSISGDNAGGFIVTVIL